MDSTRARALARASYFQRSTTKPDNITQIDEGLLIKLSPISLLLPEKFEQARFRALENQITFFSNGLVDLKKKKN